MEELVKRDLTFVNDQPTWDHVECEKTGYDQWPSLGGQDPPVWFCITWWDAENAEKMRGKFDDSTRHFTNCLVYDHSLQFWHLPLSAPGRYASCRSAA